MKTYLTILLSLLLAPVLTFAAYTDVTMSGSSVISVGGYSLVVSGTASLDSITVNADNFTLSLSKNAQLVVTSTDRRSYTVSPSQYAQSFTCGSSESTLAVGNNLWDSTITVTVTPSTSACAIGGGGSVGGGGGGSGVPTPVQTTIPGLATTATPTAPSVAQPSPVAQIVSPVFNKALRYGVTSTDVTRLQQLLAKDKEIYPEGIVSGWFGQLTRKAVQKFQAKYGIVSSGDENTTGYGALGPKTRAKIQEVFGGQPSTTTPVLTPSTQTIEQIQAKIQEILEKIKLLQEQIKAL